eukprot:3039364-Prymnesium_polylepis.3
MQPHFLNEGDVLCTQGGVGDEMWVVLRGRLEVTYIPEGNWQVHTVCEMGFGDVVGEVAMFDNGTFKFPNASRLRTATLCAKEEMEMYTLLRADVMEMCDKFSDVRVALVNLGNMRLERTSKFEHKATGLASPGAVSSLTFVKRLKEKTNPKPPEPSSTTAGAGAEAEHYHALERNTWAQASDATTMLRTRHLDQSRDQTSISRNLGMMKKKLRQDRELRQPGASTCDEQPSSSSSGAAPASSTSEISNAVLASAIEAALAPLVEDVKNLNKELSPLKESVALMLTE